MNYKAEIKSIKTGQVVQELALCASFEDASNIVTRYFERHPEEKKMCYGKTSFIFK